MSILFIDLTDGKGVGRKSRESLVARYGQNEVIYINSMQMAREFANSISYQNPQGAAIDEVALNLLAQSQNTNLADITSIMIAAHGTRYDAQMCYHDEFGNEGELMSAKNLARFAGSVFRALQLTPVQTTNITLLICYAARTERWNQEHAAHNGIDYTQTFAHQFTAQLRHESTMLDTTPVAVKAYTGAVKVGDDASGHLGSILCQQEQHILRLEEREQARQNMRFCAEQGMCIVPDRYVFSSPCFASYQRYGQTMYEIDSIPYLQNYGKVVYNVSNQGTDHDVSHLGPARAVHCNTM